MKIWLVTTGSSDVQLQNNYYWREWHRQAKKKYYNLPFEPQPFNPDDADTSYRVPPRILGIAYQEFPDEIAEVLCYPLLDEFTPRMQQEAVDKIIVLLTDQSSVFDEDTRSNDKKKCPYWQDTCELWPILEHYFQKQFPEVDLLRLVLAPTRQPGLDDWNESLALVRDALSSPDLEAAISHPDAVYVSHQAGTPAISSAVQFVSLARFRNNVQFLVSNEYDRQTRTISRSTYLHGIQLQEAKALLERHDYSGVRTLLGLTREALAPEEKRIKYLLNAAEQWNSAEFQKFKRIVTERNLLHQVSFPWWRLGYESAYLAWVRLKQGSTVDAMFHAFRAVEGTAGCWAEKKYGNQYLERDSEKGLQLKYSICNLLQGMNSWFGDPQRPKQKIAAYGKIFFALVRETYTDWRIDQHISLFCKAIERDYTGKNIFEERNKLFHRLEGLQKEELFGIWKTDESGWETRVLGCLNFIAHEEVPNGFKSFEEASLMAQVHQELERAIADL